MPLIGRGPPLEKVQVIDFTSLPSRRSSHRSGVGGVGVAVEIAGTDIGPMS